MAQTPAMFRVALGWDRPFRVTLNCPAVFSVGIDLKELGGQLPKCLKFCPGIEV